MNRYYLVSKLYKTFNILTLSLCTVTLVIPSSYAKPQKCALKPVATQTHNVSLSIDEKEQKFSLETIYGFSPAKEKGTYTVSKISSIVFDDFKDIVSNFVKKRVGPRERCDKLEVGKYKVNTDKAGIAHGYFVARYENKMCFHLRFFASDPGGIDRDMFVLTSSNGITGVGLSFQPLIDKSGFSIAVNATYEAIVAPSIFGRSEAVLTDMYKDPLDNFLSEKSFSRLVSGIMPAKKSGFKLTGIGFRENKDKKIELTLLAQKSMAEQESCSFRNSLVDTHKTPRN